MLTEAKNILQKTFGYSSFYPVQEKIILSVLNKKDVVVIMPTGGGKSICYQIPALIFNGLTVVVSPLISLMQDQVNNLNELGINACLLSSSITREEYDQNKKDLLSGKVRILYVAPETMMKEGFITFLRHVKPVFFAVDEAHCISHWGHDFRPEYRQLSKLKTIFPESQIIALTATATKIVREDIKKSLNLTNPEEFIASFDRSNIFLEVREKNNTFQQTIDFLSKFKNQSGIIYCFSRKQVDELYEKLLKIGYSVKPYHAGLSDADRKRNQEQFIKDDIQIIVATIAFGMGINKPNVRFVLHYDLPKNIESYYQEIGRAGRDGLPAHCLLLYSYSDTRKIQYFIDEKDDLTQKQIALKQLRDIVKYSESKMCRRFLIITYFGENYNKLKCDHCDICTRQVENVDKKDITDYAKLIVETILKTGSKFGAIHIINVLRGSNEKKVIQYNHNNLSVFGKGKEKSRDFWQNIVKQLINEKVIIKDFDEFGILKLHENAKQVLENQIQVFGNLEIEESSKYSHEKNNAKYDEELFDILRRKRKELADYQKVPPYVIFSDVSLISMATIYPKTKEEFNKISGVGSVKLEKYGDIFLLLIQQYLSKNPDKIAPEVFKSGIKKDFTPKHIVTSTLFNQGKSVEEIAEEYDIQAGTVFDHSYKFIIEGNILNTEKLFSYSGILKEQMNEIFTEFDSEGTLKLKPIFEKFNERISYDDLKLARIFYLMRK